MSYLRLASSLTLSIALGVTLMGCPPVVIGPGDTSGGGGEGPSTCVTAADCKPNACASVSCQSGACTYDVFPAGASCDDGLACTVGETCQAGQCAGGKPKECDVTGPCMTGACDEAQGGCIAIPVPDGTACGGGDPCSGGSVCIGGVCESGPIPDCSFLSTACALGVCEPGIGCVAEPTNEGGLCDDGLFCTSGDHCKAGSCVGVSPCPEPGGCFVAACDEATKTCGQKPGNDGASCELGNPCLTGFCSAGQCAGSPVPDGTPCDDGNVCTSNTTCTAGVCGGGLGPTLFFTEDFHDNAKGWTLGQEWEIASAALSAPGTFGNDPANDHSPSGDNGVAGINIGGNASTVLHPFFYLESPSFSTAGGPGGVVLQFYRWLVSDYPPFMTNTVEVWNGSQWVIVWQSPPNQAINDTSWTFQQINISQYQGPSTKIRFGMTVGSQGAFNVGSWNVDDILVASSPCP